ncbi:CDC45-like protein [Violaceomyces palustris]|uniref:CDC45-like protein n=1 Tax=Violaceomyces palustris TaxID=1673888 RepID=A0ACD0NRS9_9BASI|nr:CDC45-like protein [Violaceomyces palustris]
MVIISCPTNHLIDRLDLEQPVAASSRAKDYSHAYHQIMQLSRNSRSSSTSVLILVATDIDAIAATRILTSLLTEDDVPHRVVPVEGYRGLMRILEDDVSENHDLQSLVFINLGSVLSLPNSIPLPQRCHLHVIDSHRPWNLENLFATSEVNERIWIWDDGEILGKMSRQGGEREAFERLEFDVDDSEGEGSDEESGSDAASDRHTDEEDASDAEEDEGQGEIEESAKGSQSGRRAFKRKRKKLGSEHGSDDGEGSSSDVDSIDREKRRRRKRDKSSRGNKEEEEEVSTRLSPQERQRFRAVLSRYYQRGTMVGMSVAGMIYLLAEKLGRGGRERLWLAIIGLTSQYLSNAIDFETYDAYSAAYASEAFALEPNSGKANLDPWSVEAVTGASSSGGEEGMKRGADADDRSIRVVNQELRFTLYRHWSLETSMYHTAYVAAKIGVWREKGMSRLRGLMAKMGFSLSACRQSYSHMPLDLRKTLVSRLESIAPEYGMTELTYRSFIRSFGFRSSPLSAADVVEGASALLVAGHGVKIEVELPGMSFGGISNGPGSVASGYGGGGNGSATSSELFGATKVWNISGTDSIGIAEGSKGASAGNVSVSSSALNDGIEDEEADRLAADRARDAMQDVWVRNFFEAYKALDARRASSIELLRSSLLLSQSLHRAIINRGISLITNQSIRTLKSFRLAILKDGPDLELFSNVETLSRLARWLVDALRDIVTEQERKKELGKRERKRARKAARRANRAGKKAATSDTEEESDLDLIPVKTLPFILACLDPARDTFLVLGQTGSPHFGDVAPNRFGLAFQDAAAKSGARVRHDRFETAAIEVRRGDFGAFVEGVHLRAA